MDAILGKALRAEPEERYASVEALANHIRAYLDNKPVAARSGNTWYHARKFLRRYWVTVAAASVAIASLPAIGLYVANRQEALCSETFSAGAAAVQMKFLRSMESFLVCREPARLGNESYPSPLHTWTGWERK